MIAIDANIFLEIFLKQEKSEECKNFLKMVNARKLRTIVSAFTVDSVLIIMERNKRPHSEMKDFLLSLIRSLVIYNYPNLNPDKAWAIKYMEKYHLDFEDALTLQCALTNKCKEIVSFDRDFDKVKEIKRLTPKDAVEKYGKNKIK